MDFTRVSVENSLLPLLTSCLVVFSGCWLVENSDFWHSSGSDSLCFGGTFDKLCRTICFLSDVRIIRHHRHQMMFPWVKNPFFCGAQAPKVDCCLAYLRSTRYETSVGMTQPVTDLEMWKFPSQRIQEKQEDDLVQLMAGASSWHLEVDWKMVDGVFAPQMGLFWVGERLESLLKMVTSWWFRG